MPKPPRSILVVDDDDAVRETIRSLLDDEGFTVTTAATGLEALDLVEARKFDLAVVDIHLKDEFDGIDLVQHARSQQPGLRSLFISGLYSRATDDPDRDDFVSKPFRPHELLGCVWELLHRKVPEPANDSILLHARRAILAAKIDCLRNRRGRRVEDADTAAADNSAATPP
ncbi:MAG TPA: response regulator [Stellaceae bacterium]|jgi:CheY-like chemotaxis protein